MSESYDPQQLDDEVDATILGSVIIEAREIIDHLNLCLIQLDQDFKDEALIDTITRGFHTMKGSSGFAGLNQLGGIAKSFEMYMREVKKGALTLTATSVNLMYEGLDAIAHILDRAEANDFTAIEDAQLLEKVEKLKSGEAIDAANEIDVHPEASSNEFAELLKVYRDGYNQLTALKHLMFASINLEDPERLATLLSKQIHDHIGTECNSIWLIDQSDNIVEIACNGKWVETPDRRIFKSDDSEIFQRLMHEQLIFWPTDLDIFKLILPEYKSPVIFPIKMKTSILGLLIIDQKDKTEIEVFQFIAQFAAMMMHISQLHQKVEEQKGSLDEMTGILFKQNTHLSALYHVQMRLMQEKDPVKLCQIVVDALVSELDCSRSVAFLHRASKNLLLCAAQNGGFKEIVGTHFELSEIRALQQGVENGRLVAHIDYGEPLRIGPNLLEDWIAIAIKGRKKIHGVVVVEVGDESFSDAITTIAYFLGALLDNILMLQQSQKA